MLHHPPFVLFDFFSIDWWKKDEDQDQDEDQDGNPGDEDEDEDVEKPVEKKITKRRGRKAKNSV